MVLDPARLLDLCHREVHAARCRAARFDEHLGFGDLAQRDSPKFAHAAQWAEIEICPQLRRPVRIP